MAIGDTLSGYTFVFDLGKFQVETVHRIDGLSIGPEGVEFKRATSSGELLTSKQPRPARSGEIVITRGSDRSEVFTDWIFTTLAGHEVDDDRQDILVTVIDRNMKPVKRIRLSRAWASDWQGPSLQAGADDSATETVTIVFADFEVENVEVEHV